jgi:hypothetical protein
MAAMAMTVAIRWGPYFMNALVIATFLALRLINSLTQPVQFLRQQWLSLVLPLFQHIVLSTVLGLHLLYQFSK